MSAGPDADATKRTRSSWYAMRRRCSPLANGPERKHYFERGIRVCAAWINSFPTFLADMGPRPTDRSIDRIKNDLGYDCGKCGDCNARNAGANCRWATRIVQARNRRGSGVIVDGKQIFLADIRHGAAYAQRIRKGMSPERAVSKPVFPQPEAVRNWHRRRSFEELGSLYHPITDDFDMLEDVREAVADYMGFSVDDRDHWPESLVYAESCDVAHASITERPNSFRGSRKRRAGAFGVSFLAKAAE